MNVRFDLPDELSPKEDPGFIMVFGQGPEGSTLEFMDKWLGKYKSWYRFVIGSYRDRFEELLKTIDAIAFARLDERLEYYLKKF